MSIIKAKTSDCKYVLINLEDYKNNELLNNAYIFKTLFGINDNCSFGNYDMEKDEEGNITLLEGLGISLEDWYLFNSFLKNGFPPYYIDYKNNNNILDMLLPIIEKINRVNILLGGIPSFDIFYKIFYDNNKYDEIYNPINPEQDIKQLYDWDLYDPNWCYTLQKYFIENHNVNDGWSITSCFEKCLKVYKWYRKKKSELSKN